MSNSTSMSTCSIVCWIIAAIAGLLAFLIAHDPISFVAALLLGLALTVFFGLVLTRLFCLSGQDVAVPVAADRTASETGAAKAPPEATEAGTQPVDTSEEIVPDATEATNTSQIDHSEADDDHPAAVKAGTLLSGEQELAGRKGVWTYNSGSTGNTTEADAIPGVLVGDSVAHTGEGNRPEALKSPRDGKADDLKQIKGIGPKLEKLCNSMGFYHFDQIAAWTADEVAWVNANLVGFKGRVTRDTWVEQAKTLASGGETEFSKRVEDGDVY